MNIFQGCVSMICDFINPKAIIFELDGTDRDEVLAELTEKLITLKPNLKRDVVFKALVEREEKKSSLVCKNLAVPHAVLSDITESVVALGLSHKGIEFDMSNSDIETNTAKVVFTVIFPENKPDEHLQILKDILVLEKEADFMNKVLRAENSSEICDIINKSGV